MSITTSDRKARRATWLVLSSLVGGLLLGVLSNQFGTVRETLITIASTVGGLWLDGLKMTVIPLIIALLITGVVSGADQARAGRIAARSVLWFAVSYTHLRAHET